MKTLLFIFGSRESFCLLIFQNYKSNNINMLYRMLINFQYPTRLNIVVDIMSVVVDYPRCFTFNINILSEEKRWNSHLYYPTGYIITLNKRSRKI